LAAPEGRVGGPESLRLRGCGRRRRECVLALARKDDVDRRVPSTDQETVTMRYLGKISGSGMLTCDGEQLARASYDFDGYFRKPMGVTSCGEIRMPASVLKDVFWRHRVQLLTDDGRVLDLRFTEKSLPSDSDVAHVDVTGGLPATPQYWRH
jgi:hypothetical protein